MSQCQQCHGEIDDGRNQRVLATLGRPARFCGDCSRKLQHKRDINQARRDRNAALRELCGTSAAAARLDMGLA